jgi:hypothetical protein
LVVRKKVDFTTRGCHDVVIYTLSCLELKERRHRRRYFRAINRGLPRYRITILKRRWRIFRKRVHIFRKRIYKARCKRITIRIKVFRRKFKRSVRKMLRFRKLWKRALRRGNHRRAYRLKRKFFFYQRRVRIFRVKLHTFVRHKKGLKLRRFAKLFRRAAKRARKLRRILNAARRGHGMNFRFCATVIKGQYKKALLLAHKYRHLFHKIKVSFHH